jgi:hypothetical protein
MVLLGARPFAENPENPLVAHDQRIEAAPTRVFRRNGGFIQPAAVGITVEVILGANRSVEILGDERRFRGGGEDERRESGSGYLSQHTAVNQIRRAISALFFGVMRRPAIGVDGNDLCCQRAM